MNKYFKLTLLVMGLLCTSAFAQQKTVKKLESHIAAAFSKAYPASVRMWGFDTLRNERTSAQFSGVVVTADGHILTAAHTTQPGNTYKVFFPDGKVAIALALGKIEVKETPGAPDVGMMKILTPGKWPYAAMGFSESLRKEEICLSISYPESLDQPLPTLRLGKIAEVKNEYGFIQSTCKMEPGDSGGPLFNLQGQVIGLHSAIDVSENMNFEVPVDLYRKYWTALQQEQRYNALPTKTDSIAITTTGKPTQKEPILELQYQPNVKSCTFPITSLVNGNERKITATLINLSNQQGEKIQFLLSKSSMIGEQVKVNLAKGAVKAEVVARDKANDLVLLRVAEKIVGGLKLEDANDEVTNLVGKILFTPTTDGGFAQSVAGSNPFNLTKKTSLPYLGAMVVYNASPAVFSLVKPGSPAESIGLQVGDELVSVGGHLVKKSSEFGPLISQYWPDDLVELKWTREGTSFTKMVKLKAHDQGTSNHPAEKFLGGKSVRRDGFTSVYAHDLALNPALAGSPVFDGEGRFIGVNIARFSRTTTLIIPTEIIRTFIKKTIAEPQTASTK